MDAERPTAWTTSKGDLLPVLLMGFSALCFAALVATNGHHPVYWLGFAAGVASVAQSMRDRRRLRAAKTHEERLDRVAE